MESLRRAETVQGYDALWRVNATMAREVLRLSSRGPEDPNAGHEFVSVVAFSRMEPPSLQALMIRPSGSSTLALAAKWPGCPMADPCFRWHSVPMGPYWRPVPMTAWRVFLNFGRIPCWRRSRMRAGAMVVAFSPDGNLVASGGADQYARVFAARSGVAAASFRSGPMYCQLRFSPNGKLLATGSADNAARIFDIGARAERVKVEHGRLMIAHEAGVN